MPKGDKTPSIYDWPKLYSEFLKAQDDAQDQGLRLTLETWAAQKDLNYTYASKQFAELSRLLTANKLALIAPKAARKLDALLDVDDDNIAHKAAVAILDRAGHSPAAIQVAIQNNVTSTVVLPPIFPANYADDMKKMLEGKGGDDAA